MSEVKTRDAEVWSTVQKQKAVESLFNMVAKIGGTAALIGLLKGFFASFTAGTILWIAVSVIVLIAAAIKADGCKKQIKELVDNQLGSFVDEEFGRVLGACELVKDEQQKKAFQMGVWNSGLLKQHWDTYYSDEHMIGNYQGLKYETSNLRIQEKVTSADGEGDTNESLENLFSGVWITCRQIGRVSNPMTVKARDSKFFRKDRCIVSGEESDKQRVPLDEVIRVIEQLEQLSGGKVQISFAEDQVHFALSGGHLFRQTEQSHARHAKSLEDIKGAIQKEFEYEASVLGLIRELSFIAK